MQDVRRVLRDVRSHIEEMAEFAPLADTAEIILGEVLNNVVEHAYQFDVGHPIELSVAFGVNALDIRINDGGIAMPNGTLPEGHRPILSHDARNDLPEGGFGWAMIHELTTELAYRRENGRNHLSFAIPLPSATSDSAY